MGPLAAKFTMAFPLIVDLPWLGDLRPQFDLKHGDLLFLARQVALQSTPIVGAHYFTLDFEQAIFLVGSGYEE